MHRHESPSDLQAALEGHRVAISGAVTGPSSSQLQHGHISVDISDLKAASPVYASTAPRDLSGAVSAVPVSGLCTNESVDPIAGLGLVMTQTGNISCAIFPGDLVCYKKQSAHAERIETGMVAKISWPEDRTQLCSRQSSVKLVVLPSTAAASSSRLKEQTIPLAAVVSTACWLSAADHSRFFPDERYACAAASCLSGEFGRWQALLGKLASRYPGLIPSWKRVEVLVQRLGADHRVQSAICR